MSSRPGIRAVIVVSPVCLGVSALLRIMLSLCGIGVWRAASQSLLLGAYANWKACPTNFMTFIGPVFVHYVPFPPF